MYGSCAARYGEKIITSKLMTGLKATALVWCVAGSSSIIRGAFVAPTVAVTIRISGTAVWVFGWCCPHQYFSESLVSVSLNSGARSAPARRIFENDRAGSEERS